MSTLIKILISLAISYNSIEVKSEYQSLTQEKTLEQSIKDGQWVYKEFCVRCHLPSGKGVSGVYPPLAKSDWLISKIDKSIASIKYGLKGKIVVNGVTYNNVMTAQGLSDEEVADVMNYIMNSWGNTQEEMVTVEKVKSIEKNN